MHYAASAERGLSTLRSAFLLRATSYGHGAEGESNSITTASGWGATVLSFLAGFVARHLVEGHPIAPTGKADAWGWFVGSLVMTFGGIPLWKLFSQTSGVVGFFGNMLELGLTGIAVLIGLEVSRRKKSAG